METSDLRSHLGMWLRLVSNRVSGGFAEALREKDVSVAEWVVLRELQDREDTAPSVVAEATGMSRGAASKVVEKLVQRGLVTRVEDDGDRRYLKLRLTREGRKLVPVLARIADANEERFFSVMSGREREQLRGLLEGLVQKHGWGEIPTE